MDWTRLPLSRATVDRAAHRRTADVLAHALADPGTSLVLVHEGRLAVEPDRAALARVTPGDAPELAAPAPGDDQPLHMYLGQDAGVDVVGVALSSVRTRVDIEGVALPGLSDLVGRLRWATLREVGHELSDRDAGLAATAVGLAAWHARHPRCARCGAPTEPDEGGWTRRCTQDDSQHYPRTDPAVIMAVVDDDDRLLLGHATHWPQRRFSTLAGYVEPGESLEAAVRREVQEEVGVRVGEVDYRGSQPWPFPASLMLAFRARAVTTELRPDGVEMSDARWFTRAELSADVAAGRVLLPTRTSVARALVEEWFGGPVERD